jgi:S-DNA-T family DNA segregation ATPase FtsK/SpoIIIE
MPTRTTAARKRRRGKPRRRRFGAGVWLRLPILEQRDFDLIGLALVALGVFLACVLYLGWSGGQMGAALTAGFAYLVGALVYALPVALTLAGALVIMRPLLPSGRPFGAAAGCLLCALTLGFAAGTLGLGPGGAQPAAWDSAFVQRHGGVVGEALYTVVDRAVQPLGAHILAVFLFAAGVLLLTGATVAGVIDAARGGLTGAGRRLRASSVGLGAALRRHVTA